MTRSISISAVPPTACSRAVRRLPDGEPELVADCIAAMKAAVDVPVTVKCRIGVDEQDPEQALDRFCRRGGRGRADAIIVHARKAWLDGLCPKENRDVPPLDYDRGAAG